LNGILKHGRVSYTSPLNNTVFAVVVVLSSYVVKGWLLSFPKAAQAAEGYHMNYFLAILFVLPVGYREIH